MAIALAVDSEIKNSAAFNRNYFGAGVNWKAEVQKALDSILEVQKGGNDATYKSGKYTVTVSPNFGEITISDGTKELTYKNGKTNLASVEDGTALVAVKMAQVIVGTRADGKWGYRTQNALTRLLQPNDQSFYQPRPPPPKIDVHKLPAPKRNYFGYAVNNIAPEKQVDYLTKIMNFETVDLKGHRITDVTLTKDAAGTVTGFDFKFDGVEKSADLTASGLFVRQVRAFQAGHGLEADAFVGPKTMAALKNYKP